MFYSKTFFRILLGIMVLVFTACSNPEGKRNEVHTAVDSSFIHKLNYDNIPFSKDSAGVKRALHYTDSVYYLLPSPGLAEKLFRYDRMVTFFYSARRYHESIQYCDSIISLIESENAIAQFPSQYASAFFAAGDAYTRMGNYSKAYNCFFNARKRTIKYVDSCALSDYTYRIGISLYRAGQYSEAIRYFKTCINPSEVCRKEFKYNIRRQELLSNIGLCFYKLDQPDSALKYYTLTLDKIKTSVYPTEELANTSPATGVVYGNMGKAYLHKGDTLAAESCFKRNIEINLLPNHDWHDAHFSLMDLANTYVAQKKFDKAADLLNRVKASIDTFNYDDTRQKWLLSSSYYYKCLGKPAVSNQLLNTLLALQDSIEGKEREFKEMDVQQYILTLENQEENKLLKQENEKKQLIVIFAVSIVVSLLVLLLGGILLYKRTRNFLKQLTELNRTIELQKEQLEQRNKDKDHILRIVAHDLRNPIWGINALSKIVLDEMSPSDKFYENIKLIYGSSHSTMTLINELVDATMDLDQHIERSNEDIYAVISNVVEVLKHRAAEKFQNLIWTDAGKSLCLPFNREKISRVINNLIYNAIKFSHRGGNIEITATTTQENIVIAIKDYGVGIPTHMQDKIFDMFTAAKREGTAGEKSIGLGLSICRGIAESHGGKLWLESKEEEGTTFFLQLPLAK